MIPNIIHFVFGLDRSFGDRPFSIVHYIAIKSAFEINKPKNIFFYYKYEPIGYWWEKVKFENLVTPILISVPRQVYGNKLYHYAHKSDVVRLMILLKYGGIYLDIDTICVKPLTEMLNYKVVMAKEMYFGEVHGLCNAVILSESNSIFLKSWLASYVHFRSKGRDEFWAEHSVRVPLKIAELHPTNIHIEPEEKFFYPSYFPDQLELLFKQCRNFPEAYVIHLWESLSYKKYLEPLTIEIIKKVDTSYNVLARKYLQK